MGWSPPRFVGQVRSEPPPRLVRDEPERAAPETPAEDAAVFIGNLAPGVTQKLLQELLVQAPLLPFLFPGS